MLKKFCSTILVGSIFVSAHLGGQGPLPVLHALIICDTSAAQFIEASLNDASRVEAALAQIAKVSQMVLKATVIYDKEFSKKRLNAWIRSIPKDSQDSVFVYYSGQGKNTGKSRWPLVKLRNERKGTRYISERRIAEKVRNQHPKFSIVLFDCYGKGISSDDAVLAGRQNDVVSDAESHPGLETLFTRHSGSIMACSGKNIRKIPAVSRGRQPGGVFTTAFLKALLRWGDNGLANWSNIAFHSKILRQPRRESSTPIFDLKTKNHSGNRLVIRAKA